MLKLFTKKNTPVHVPENLQEDQSKRFNFNQIKEAKIYYEINGYVVFNKCIKLEINDLIRSLWSNYIKIYTGKIYRQTTGKAEKNIFNKSGFVMNPLLNIQSLNPSKFKNFKETVEKEVFNNKKICSILNIFFNHKPKIIQSMYFEGNSVTGEHQDTYYLDADKIGGLTAVWVALEEIKPDAGRFFVYPGSHKIHIEKIKYYNQILSNHDLYIDELISICKKNNLTVKAPYLNKGDVLFWNSKTVHGSLNSQSINNSRSSITFHAIPENSKFLHWHKHFIDTPTDDLGNSIIYRRKDQKFLINRIILLFESHMENITYFVKKIISKYIFKQKHY